MKTLILILILIIGLNDNPNNNVYAIKLTPDNMEYYMKLVNGEKGFEVDKTKLSIIDSVLLSKLKGNTTFSGIDFTHYIRQYVFYADKRCSQCAYVAFTKRPTFMEYKNLNDNIICEKGGGMAHFKIRYNIVKQEILTVILNGIE